MEPRLSVQLKNDLAELERLNELLTEFADREGLPSELVFRVNLALEEIVTNVISYGYEDEGEHQISVCLFWDDPHVKIEVEDDGRAFNPLETPPPDTGKLLADRPVGGLGIHLVREMMDQLDYHRVDGRNFLVLQTKVRES